MCTMALTVSSCKQTRRKERASLRALRDATMNAIDSIKEFLAESKDTNEVEVDLYVGALRLL